MPKFASVGVRGSFPFPTRQLFEDVVNPLSERQTVDHKSWSFGPNPKRFLKYDNRVENLEALSHAR